jgi:hypothetical protein
MDPLENEFKEALAVDVRLLRVPRRCVDNIDSLNAVSLKLDGVAPLNSGCLKVVARV